MLYLDHPGEVLLSPQLTDNALPMFPYIPTCIHKQ